ncbi:hypothetical protein ACFRMQ_00935 [Kitasatospora sp. NPDC056783]|uniref:hypothetical protein n=1 Tax=Kitasatospora sp. NPDC056783 TaxID=3345943 RepID=UPI0036C627DF
MDSETVAEIETIFTELHIAPTACHGINEPCDRDNQCCTGLHCDLEKNTCVK